MVLALLLLLKIPGEEKSFSVVDNFFFPSRMGELLLW